MKTLLTANAIRTPLFSASGACAGDWAPAVEAGFVPPTLPVYYLGTV